MLTRDFFKEYLPDSVNTFINKMILVDPFIWVPVILVLVVSLWLIIKLKNKVPNKPNPFLQVGELLSPAERSFYGQLCHACSGERAKGKALVIAKAAMHDIIKAQQKLPGVQQHIQLKSLARINFDFVICDRKDLSVLCVIELKNELSSSANTAKEQTFRSKRQQYLTQKCSKAQLPIHCLDAQKKYPIEELSQLIWS